MKSPLTPKHTDRQSSAIAIVEVTNLPQVGADLGSRIASAFHESIDGLIRRLAVDATVESTAGRWIVDFDQHAADLASVEASVRELAGIFDRPLEVDGHALHAIVHIGVSHTSAVGEHVMLHDAEVALRSGIDNNVRIKHFDPSSTNERGMIDSSSTTLGELSRAVWNGGLFVEYQPKVDLRSLTLNGCEALVRWAHPVHGRVAPNDFIGLAEQSHLIRPLTFHVLDDALEVADALRAGPLGQVSINVSSFLLRSDEFIDDAIAVVRNSGVAPNSIEFEVTERALNRSDCHRSLHRLRSVGIRVAVDDFGVGYSSLSTIAHLPVDVIKLDRSFIAGIGTNRVNQLAVGAVVELAGECGQETVAEGIETHDELDVCASLGVASAQGFLFSPAVPRAELVELASGVAN